jgi:hypothetical protein
MKEISIRLGGSGTATRLGGVSETLEGVNISVFLPRSETGASDQETVDGTIEVASASVKNCAASKSVGEPEI